MIWKTTPTEWEERCFLLAFLERQSRVCGCIKVWGCAWLMMGVRNGSLLLCLLGALTPILGVKP